MEICDVISKAYWAVQEALCAKSLNLSYVLDSVMKVTGSAALSHRKFIVSLEEVSG